MAPLAESIDVFDFKLSEEGREAIRGLDTGKSIILDRHDLASVEFLLSIV